MEGKKAATFIVEKLQPQIENHYAYDNSISKQHVHMKH